MCKFFSVRSDGAGKVYYLNNEQRKKVRAQRNNPDSHTFIAEYYGFKGEDEDMFNAYEYDFETQKLVVDRMPNKDDRELVRKFIESLKLKDIDVAEYQKINDKQDKEKKVKYYNSLIGKPFKFKTKKRFIKEYGYNNKFPNWASNGEMDYLYGKKFILKSIDVNGSHIRSEEGIEDKCSFKSHWNIDYRMVVPC